MASVRKRGDKFQAQVRRSGLNPITKTFHKRSDALEWARAMEFKADRNDLPISVKELGYHKVSSIIEKYRDEISIKKKSYNSEVFILNAFLKTPLANKTLAQINSVDFAAYREERLQKVKAGTVNREFAIVKHAFDIAMNEWGFVLRENPLNKVKKLKVNNARTRRLDPYELEAICKAAKATRNVLILPIILFALETGMRRGEILAMRWVDIDFNVRTLSIPITKNGHSRTIPLTGEAVRILQEGRNEDIKVFPITANSLRMAWDRLVIRAKIEDLHFHDLRHEAISRFFEKGLSVPEVALISGHRDFRMLFRYTHLRAEDLVRKL